MDTYTPEEMNQAISRVDAAKQRHPIGWSFLGELNLPTEELVTYTFANAHAHIERLEQEDDPRVIYSVGWLNGIGVGVALGEQRGVR
jgi:hypothetical protein